MRTAILSILTAASAQKDYIIKFSSNDISASAEKFDKAAWVADVLAQDKVSSASAVSKPADEFSMPGFEALAGTYTDAEIKEIESRPEVEYVEEVTKVTKFDAGVQRNPTWGLDRIDDRTGLDRSYEYTSDGSGATVYVVDSGVYVNHPDFNGRAELGQDFTGEGDDDLDGHGTHVAGTVGSTTYGVAKGVKIVAVKVLDRNGNGTSQGVIGSMNWIARQATRNRAVANFSLGGPASRAIDDGIAALVRAGVTVVSAAGNENQDACNVSPSRSSVSITVGNANRSDRRSFTSNWGRCVNIFAPGAGILSLLNRGSGTTTISGTSMAAPHVAGVAALILGRGAASPRAVADKIYGAATTGVISDLRGSPNRTLYSLVD